MRKWTLGLGAALLIAVVAAGVTTMIDDQAPAALIGAFWGVLAFLAGAAGAERYSDGPTLQELGVRVQEPS
ncbi:MAG: hypothetical protein M0R73_03410 [Dehalococcoidia bacterium]|nr:hypothetical protein [Dehalococcoidia bacterium]